MVASQQKARCNQWPFGDVIPMAVAATVALMALVPVGATSQQTRAATDGQVDLELVLAVDASASVNQAEFVIHRR